MRKIFTFLFIFAGLVFNIQAQEVKSLFNGTDLSNWDIHIGTALRGFDDLLEEATPENTYSVVEVNGQNLLFISGKVNASIATKEEFQNYHLTLEYKWGETMYTSFNSGLLYHSYGDFGGGLGTWMNSIECQLQTGNNGDAYSMGTTAFDVKVNADNAYDANGTLTSFGDDQEGGEIARKRSNNENPHGEWNVIELYSVGRKTIHVVNGVKVMECENTGKIVDGNIVPMTGGKIQIQSEGGELYIRKIEIENISSIPNI